METKICRNCNYFHQHYVIDDQRYMAVPCGHCSKPRLKPRKPSAKVCAHFSQRTVPAPLPDRSEVVNFLSKRMLQQMLERILELPLPPEEGEG